MSFSFPFLFSFFLFSGSYIHLWFRFNITAVRGRTEAPLMAKDYLIVRYCEEFPIFCPPHVYSLWNVVEQQYKVSENGNTQNCMYLPLNQWVSSVFTQWLVLLHSLSLACDILNRPPAHSPSSSYLPVARRLVWRGHPVMSWTLSVCPP